MFKNKRILCELEDGSSVFFANGSFDEWCVYVSHKCGKTKAPLDTEYFRFFQLLSMHYGKVSVYYDFMKIFNATTKDVNAETLLDIKNISKSYYCFDRIDVERNFVVIYAGMIAEENKENAILKKKMKRIGFYQSVVMELSADFSANFSRGKGWRELMSVYNKYFNKA